MGKCVVVVVPKSVITRTRSLSYSFCCYKKETVRKEKEVRVIKMEEGGTSSSSSAAAASCNNNNVLSEGKRSRLSEVVNDCVKRWFNDTLKEAKAGDTSMQVLVGQMYNSGYGIPKDPQKGRAWINRASRNRSSVWKVCEKQPGYNASDSDSDDVKGDGK